MDAKELLDRRAHWIGALPKTHEEPILRALSLLASTEGDSDEVVRELHALRESAKPFPSGAGGQQCGMESYRIVASGNQLEVIYTAAARILALKAELAEREQTERDLRRVIERGKPVSEREKELSAVCDGYIKGDVVLAVPKHATGNRERVFLRLLNGGVE